MTPQCELSKPLFETIVQHLVNIEEQKNRLLEEYFPNQSRDRTEFINLLDDYIKQIDQVIRNTVISKNANNSFPFVIINSEVVVEDLNSHETCLFRILPPFQDTGVDGVSYLSPVGRTLLLKKLKDKVTINAPGGKFEYKINSIKLNFLQGQ